VTTDNFFTSYDLGQFLLTQNTTLLGTRAGRKYHPNSFQRLVKNLNQSLHLQATQL